MSMPLPDQFVELGESPFVDDRMLRVYAAWQQMHPRAPMSDFSWFVRINSGLHLSSLLTSDQMEFLMAQISPDSILAESILEGLESGP